MAILTGSGAPDARRTRAARVTGPKRVLIVEELTPALLDRYADVIASADACWALRALDPGPARRALDQGRWHTGDYLVFDGADDRLGRWAYGAVDAGPRSGPRLGHVERAALAYGLQVRLRGSARARAMIERIASGGKGPHPVRLDLVASDPYLRRAFDVPMPAVGPIDVRLHDEPDRSSWAADVRERLISSRWLRSAALSIAPRGRRRPSPGRSRRSVALFRPGRGWSDPFAPIREALRRRGWGVTVFEYSRLIEGDPDVVDFGVAAGTGLHGPFVVPERDWSADDPSLGGGPVPGAVAVRALRASWVTAAVQTERHRRVLEAWRPDVVVSFGPDTMSLALHAAARTCGIPSVFLPHGFLACVPLHWSLTANATVVPGRSCVEENGVNPLGERQRGLVAIGHPPYDEIVRAPGAPRDRALLGASPARPLLVLLFTEWGVDLLDQAMQRRTLALTAAALPDDCVLVCKLHPGREERERSEDILAALLPADAFRVVSSRELSTPTLLRTCDVAVATEESMALIDAVVAGVPAVGIRHPENPPGTGPLRHPSRHIEEVCAVAHDVDELSRALTSLTHEPSARTRLLAGRAAYAERSLYSIDGHSSERAADLIEHLSRGEGLATFEPRSPSAGST